MGTGFPVFAETEIAALYIPNLVLYSVFNTPLAWNLSYVLAVVTGIFGIYYLFRHLKLSTVAALYGSLIYGFGAYFVTHYVHISIIQTSSISPWLILLALKILERKSRLAFIFFTVLLSQSIFAGHLQHTFMTLLIIGFLVGRQIYSRKIKPVRLWFLLLAILLGTGMAAALILPSYELIREAGREHGLEFSNMFNFPFSFKLLYTFISPRHFGSPESGTYPINVFEWGFYWENIGYIGIIPLFLAGFALLYRRHSPWIKIMGLLSVFALLLVLGNQTPAAAIFRLPGFSFFRIPSRYLFILTFGLSFLSAFGLDRLSLKPSVKPYRRYFLIGIILFSLYDLWRFDWNFNPLYPAQKALKPPEITASIPESARIITGPTQELNWQAIYRGSGWQSPASYRYLFNGLAADINALYHLTSVQFYSGLTPNRLVHYEDLFANRHLSKTAAQYLISPDKISTSAAEFSLASQITAPTRQLPDYYLYHINSVLPRFRLTNNFLSVTGFNQAADQLNSSVLSQETEVIEGITVKPGLPLTQKDIQVITDDHQYLKLKTVTDQPSILIVADSFYPGWQAKVDNQAVKIYPANINQRAIVVPSGSHTITFAYHPASFYTGLIISIISLFIAVIVSRFFKKHKS
jgi:hypothetical protein